MIGARSGTGSIMPVTVEDMDSVIRPLGVVGGSLVVTLAVGWAVDHALRRADARHPETPLWNLLRRARLALQR